MLKIGLIGGGFQHAFSTTLWKKPTYFEWNKNNLEEITFYIDECISHGINDKSSKRKFAWIVESRSIVPNTIEFVKNNYKEISENYEILFTHYKEISDLAENFVLIPSHGYWIENPQIYEKNKLISMISSSKQMCEGHNFRLSWVNKLRDKVDLFGSGFKYIKRKEEGLQDYYFSVVIENDYYETYWSEKILDCFACGTIPIYHGSPDINEYFNENGIIKLTDDFKIEDLTIDLYNSKMDYIKDNLNRSLNYNIIEDIIYERYIK